MGASKGVESTPRALEALWGWYRLPLGQRLALAEQVALAAGLDTLFGYHLLVVDPPHEHSGLEISRIPHQVVQMCLPEAHGLTLSLSASGESLPIQNDCLDVVVLPHTLDLAQEPHQVLREAERCLVPEGHLVVLGFNPLGWWGLWRWLARWRHGLPWRLRFLSVPRVRDWLSLLGFDVLEVHYLFQRPPIQNERLLDRLQRLDRLGNWHQGFLSGCYLLLARKRVSTLTPIRPRWRPRRGILGAGAVEPTNRSIHQRDQS